MRVQYVKQKALGLSGLKFSGIGYFSLFMNLLGLLFYIGSIVIKNNLIIVPKILEYGIMSAYLFLFYVTFFLVLIYIKVNNSWNKHQIYLGINSSFLIIMFSLILFRTKLGEKSYTEEDMLDTSVYDEDGQRIKGVVKQLTEEEKINRERAAKSESNEREDISEGIYN